MSAQIIRLFPSSPARPHRGPCAGQHPRCGWCKAIVERERKKASRK